MDQINSHEQEKLAAWSKRLAQPVLIALDKNFQNILSGEFVERINPEAYRIPDEAVALLLCSDERLNNLNLQELFNNEREGGSIFPVRLPGAVVGQDIEVLKQKLEEYNFSKLAAASHADCGAVALDLKQKGLSVSVDQHAKDLVSDLPGIENWGFINAADDSELNSTHTGSCLLVDGTGKRNFLPDNVLPSECFILNRIVYSDDNLAKSHIKALIGIALGDHGIGSLFSPQHPFYIFVSGLNYLSLKKYMDEAELVSKDFPENLVKVVGFLAPKVD